MHGHVWKRDEHLCAKQEKNKIKWENIFIDINDNRFLITSIKWLLHHWCAMADDDQVVRVHICTVQLCDKQNEVVVKQQLFLLLFFVSASSFLFYAFSVEYTVHMVISSWTNNNWARQREKEKVTALLHYAQPLQL